LHCAGDGSLKRRASGAAIAETLSGKNNPAGRLPITTYKSVSRLRNFESYPMEGQANR
jgi:beta-glucosidase